MVSLVQINSKKVCFETEQMRFRLSLIQIQKSGLASFMPVTYFGIRTKKEMHLPLPLQTGNVILSLSITSRTLTGLGLFDQMQASLTYFYCIALLISVLNTYKVHFYTKNFPLATRYHNFSAHFEMLHYREH